MSKKCSTLLNLLTLTARPTPEESKSLKTLNGCWAVKTAQNQQYSLFFLPSFPGRSCSDAEDFFPTVNLHCRLTQQPRWKTTITSPASSALAEQLRRGFTLPSLVMSQRTQVTQARAPAAQPVSLYTQGHLSPALSSFWYLQELEPCWESGRCGAGTSRREGERPAACSDGSSAGNAEQARPKAGGRMAGDNNRCLRCYFIMWKLTVGSSHKAFFSESQRQGFSRLAVKQVIHETTATNPSTFQRWACQLYSKVTDPNQQCSI